MPATEFNNTQKVEEGNVRSLLFSNERFEKEKGILE